MEISIKDKTYKLKNTLRTIFIFEQITGKTFSIDTIIDQYIYFYSALLANNPNEFNYTFDEFVDICDDDASLISAFVDYIKEENKKQNMFNAEPEEEEDAKKKKSKKKI